MLFRRFLCAFLLSAYVEAGVDLVVFSYDRPMQLYACLESAEKYMTGLDAIHVVFRTSSSAYARGYNRVASRFPAVHFHAQSKNAGSDFKPLVLDSVFQGSAPYVLFSVDDIVVTDAVNLSQCTAALEAHNAWGFYLRLGKNITHFYMGNTASPVPLHTALPHSMMLWTFANGTGDWCYPNTVDMTVFRKNDIRPFLETSAFSNPNSLESAWLSWSRLERQGLAFTDSKVVNIPLNLVNISANRHMNLYTPRNLLKKFNKGLKIDIAPLHDLPHNSVHIDYIPQFVPI